MMNKLAQFMRIDEFIWIHRINTQIVHAHKYRNIKKFSFSQHQISLLINVKMPTISGIFILISRKKFMLS